MAAPRKWKVTLTGGPLTLNWRSYEFIKNRPVTVTNAADAEYLRSQADFSVREMIDPPPADSARVAASAPRRSAPPPETLAEVDAPHTPDEATEPTGQEQASPPKRGRKQQQAA